MRIKVLFFLVMAICQASGVKAQNDGVYFYINAEGSIDEPENNGSGIKLYEILIENGKLYYNSITANLHNLKNTAKRHNDGLTKSDIKRSHHPWVYEYSGARSNSDKIVYNYHHNGYRSPSPFQPSIPSHDNLIEFSKDMSTFVLRDTWKNNKEYYLRVSESDLGKYTKTKVFYE